MRRYAKYVVSVGLSLPVMVNAVGLGSLNIQSTLNQPLNAYIDLSLDEGTLLDGVKVTLASSDAFQRAGIERPYQLSKLTFKVTTLNDKPVIQMTSFERMNNPFINVLLDVTWAKGQFYRAYTLLLDPPGYQIVLEKPKKKRVKVFNNTDRNKPSQPLKPLSEPASPLISSLYGPTKKTDDLWDIALKYKPKNATMNQVMLGIIRLNPKAFMRGNINVLKQNITLKIPSKKMIMQTDRKVALREVTSHMSAWKDKTEVSHVLGFNQEVDFTQEEKTNSATEQESGFDSTQATRANTEKEPIKIMPVIKEALEVEINKEVQVENVLPSKNETMNNSDLTKDNSVANDEKINLIEKSKVLKEKIFDDFIHIPKILKQIVKKPILVKGVI